MPSPPYLPPPTTPAEAAELIAAAYNACARAGLPPMMVRLASHDTTTVHFAVEDIGTKPRIEPEDTAEIYEDDDGVWHVLESRTRED